MHDADFFLSDNGRERQHCGLAKAIPTTCTCKLAHTPKSANMTIERPDPFFEPVMLPENWHRMRVVVWVPELWFRRYMVHMPCINCGDVGGLVIYQGWNHRGPRVVAAVPRCYLIMCKRYKCNKCAATFNGYDQRAVLQMPDILQGRMPCFVGLKSAIDKKLAWLLSRQIVNSQSLRNFRLMVKEQLTHGF
jgi:hypothetical protein